jgi:hypothetical protein
MNAPGGGTPKKPDSRADAASWLSGITNNRCGEELSIGQGERLPESVEGSHLRWTRC